MKSNPYNWTEDELRRVVGKIFAAADGGGYGIKIVGYILEKQDFVCLSVGDDGLADYDKPPFRIDFFKASYRYKMDKEAGK